MPARTRNDRPVSIISAQKIFVDREDPRRAFKNLLEQALLRPEDYHVLHFYGRGGIGKTRLLKELRDQFSRESGITAFYDMEEGTEMRRVLTCLRNMLVQNWPRLFSFDLFDLALLRFSQVAGEQNDLVERENQSIIDSNPFLSAALEGASAIPVPAISAAAAVIFNLNKGYYYVRDIGGARRERLLKKTSGIDRLSMKELLEKLPEYFSEDLAASCRKLDRPLVIFLDTYEKLVNYLSDVGIAGNEDQWLRDGIIQFVPNCIWVIAGRDRLRWKESDPNWRNDPDYEDHLLGQLGQADAFRYLEAAGIADPQLRADLYTYTEGDPFSLSLAVSTWEDLLTRGITPSIGDFLGQDSSGNHSLDMVRRYLRDMTGDQQSLAELLACFGEWTEDQVREPAAALFGTFRPRDFEVLCRSTLVDDDGTGRYSMQKVVQNAIRSQMSTARLQQYMAQISASENSSTKEFSLDYSAGLEREISRLLVILMSRQDPSGTTVLKADPEVRSIIDQLTGSISKLEIQGNYHEACRLLKPLYQYELAADFPDVFLYRLLCSYLYALFADEQIRESYEQTKSLYTSAVAKRLRGPSIDQVSVTMLDVCNNTRRYQEMLQLAESMKREAEAAGRADTHYTELLFRYGNALSGMHRYQEAIPVMEQVLGIMRTEISDGKRKEYMLSSLLTQLSSAYSRIGKHQKALALEEEQVALLEKRYGRAHRQTLQAIRNLALSCYRLQDYSRTEQLLTEAVRNASGRYGEDSEDVLNALELLGGVYSARGNHAEALKVYQQVYERKNRKYPPGHPYRSEIFQSRYRIALEYKSTGDASTCRKLLEEGLEGFHETAGTAHADAFPTISALADQYDSENEYARGEAICREGLETVRHNPYLSEAKCNQVSKIMVWLCYYQRIQKKYAEALETARAFLAHVIAHEPADVVNRTRAYADLSRNQYALELYQEALATAEEGLAYAAEHPEDEKAAAGNIRNLKILAEWCRQKGQPQ